MFEQLQKLAGNIAAKSVALPETSYTAKLLSQGIEKCAKKFGEEAVELALASVQNKPDEVAKEAADVFYHLLVLLQATGVSPHAVMTELKHREGTSGLVEKASRQS